MDSDEFLEKQKEYYEALVDRITYKQVVRKYQNRIIELDKKIEILELDVELMRFSNSYKGDD